MPEAARRLLHAGAGHPPAYGLLDAALDPALPDRLTQPGAPAARCLLAGERGQALQHLAPWLVALPPGHPFTAHCLDQAWGGQRAVFLNAHADLPSLWRHLRQFTQVRGPDQALLYLRFHDPRVLRPLLTLWPHATCARFFGPVTQFIGEAECPPGAWCVAWQDGQLREQLIIG